MPKRSYGHGYFPFQWELAPVLDSIWFAEGFGQYAAIMAVAAGDPEPAAFRNGMLDRRFRSNLASAPPFLRRLPLVDLSRVASTRYAEDFRTGRLVFSRGGLMAAAIDDRIQAETQGREVAARRAAVPGGVDGAGTARLRHRGARRRSFAKPPAWTRARSSPSGFNRSTVKRLDGTSRLAAQDCPSYRRRSTLSAA